MTGFTRCDMAEWTDCTCTRRLDCPIFREADGYVACDRRCEALIYPTTRLDWIANAIHWHYHRYQGGCAHGR